MRNIGATHDTFRPLKTQTSAARINAILGQQNYVQVQELDQDGRPLGDGGVGEPQFCSAVEGTTWRCIVPTVQGKVFPPA